MCKQIKIGWTHCPHVHTDHDVIPCNTAIEAEAQKIDEMDEEEVGNSFCETVEWEWAEKRMLGRCCWCEKSEGDEGRAERRRMKKFGLCEGEVEGEGETSSQASSQT